MTVAVVDSDKRADNLAAFERYIPHLFVKLSNHVPQTQLVECADGSFDIEFRGQRLYDGAVTGVTGLSLARQLVDSLRGSPRGRLLIHPLDRKNLDNTTAVYVSRMLRRGVDEGINFLEAPNEDGAYHLLMVGMGLGYHLTELIEFCQPFSICVVEPNIDFLYHSLTTFDWKSLLERRDEWPVSVTVLSQGDAEFYARSMRAHCRHANPSATDGLLIAEAYANDTMQAAIKLFRRDAHLVHTGLGFFQDEMEMVRASYFNLVPHDDFRVFLQSDKRRDLPAFIVGSGPSIDDDLDFIRANQDKAVVFSCGSALGVLLANGIRPDFQVMLENGEAPRLMLESMAQKYDYTGIRLLGSNTISPQIRALFGERAFYMRKSLSSYPLFSPGNEYSLERSGPTVTNTGLEAALRSGFGEIYLFGCDLGARSPERHHSRFSPYHMTERTADYDAAVVFAQTLPDRQLGNFGGIVFTNDIMTWSRDAMEGSIVTIGAGRRIYNCSDGIRIKGARPQVSSEIRLDVADGRKAAVLDDLVGNWPQAAAFKFRERWESVDWRERVRDYADRLIAVCEAGPERTQEFLHRIGPVLITDHHRYPNFEELYLRGTVFVSAISTDYYSRRVHPPEKRRAFREIAYAELIDTLRMMVDQTDWFFDHIDELHTHTDLKEGLRVWTEDPTHFPKA